MPAIGEIIALQYVLARETTPTLHPFEHKFIRIEAFRTSELHHFTHIIDEAS